MRIGLAESIPPYKGHTGLRINYSPLVGPISIGQWPREYIGYIRTAQIGCSNKPKYSLRSWGKPNSNLRYDNAPLLAGG